MQCNHMRYLKSVPLSDKQRVLLYCQRRKNTLAECFSLIDVDTRTLALPLLQNTPISLAC